MRISEYVLPFLTHSVQYFGIVRTREMQVRRGEEGCVVIQGGLAEV